MNLRLSNTNAAKRYVVTGLFDSKLKLMEDLKWAEAPETLPDNEAYAKLSAADAAKAYFAALSKLDWAELQKFAPESDVRQSQKQVEAARKKGMDVASIMPVTQVGEATWSAEHGAYFVKCHMLLPAKKHNLALRKDNKAGRWQVDGGI